MSTPTTPQPPPAPDRPADAEVPRFREAFASFELVGTLLRPPEYRKTTHGHAVATLAVAIGEDRDIELAVFDTHGRVHNLKQRLDRIPVGATLFIRGQIQGPRTNRRETAQFVVRQLVAFPGNGVTPAASLPAPEEQQAARVPA